MEKVESGEVSEPSPSPAKAGPASEPESELASKPPAEGERNILWRVGAAISNPVRALEYADRSANAGRAPGDLTVLLLLFFIAQAGDTVARAVFIAFHGEVLGGLQITATQLVSELQWPLLLILGGAIATTVLAGSQRNLGADSDLACVGFIPSVVVLALGSLAVRLLPAQSGNTATTAAFVLAVAWFVGMCGLAVVLARGRTNRDEPTETGVAA